MTLLRQIPGAPALTLEHLLLDLNGTLTIWGTIEECLPAKLVAVSAQLEVHLLSADTYGTLDQTAASLGIGAEVVMDGTGKRQVAERFGVDSCAAIGNGANDAEMLEACALGIAIVGGEGASTAAIRAADLLCPSISVALDVLLEESGLAAGLRG